MSVYCNHYTVVDIPVSIATITLLAAGVGSATVLTAILVSLVVLMQVIKKHKVTCELYTRSYISISLPAY